jgi:hypothetical protein
MAGNVRAVLDLIESWTYMPERHVASSASSAVIR